MTTRGGGTEDNSRQTSNNFSIRHDTTTYVGHEILNACWSPNDFVVTLDYSGQRQTLIDTDREAGNKFTHGYHTCQSDTMIAIAYRSYIHANLPPRYAISWGQKIKLNNNIGPIITHQNQNQLHIVTRDTRSTTASNLYMPRMNKSVGQRSLDYLGPCTFNSLPTHIKKLTSFDMLKKQLRQNLLSCF